MQRMGKRPGTKLHKNIYVWYVTTFFTYAAFTMPIWVIFNTEVLGLSNTQAFILGILSYGLSAFLEVPTGSWADKFGRARTYQIGTALYILSVAGFIFFNNFFILLVLQIVGALGIAMQSGGLEALVHDSIGGKNKDATYAKVHANKMAIVFASRVLTVLLSGVLFAVNPRAPFVVATVAYILGLAVSFFFKEVRAETPSELSSLDHIKETLALVFSKKLLVIFLALGVLYTLCSEALFVLYQPYFKSIHINIEEYGVFYAIISALSALGALTVTAAMRRFNVFAILGAMMAAVLTTLGLMLFRQPWLAYLAVVPSSVAFGFIITLVNTYIQKRIRSRHQATALSIASFTRSLALFVSVVGVGVMLDMVSLATVNTLLAVFTLVSMLPFVAAIFRSKQTKPS